ncbi:hypothetical protein [Thermococcus piezophilus]|uniref:Uncharacterized protein n=1 Tax=Thermococcus piezophilus TaxID=1712654 RepID=A0A172WII1_9EURY|nr:hypothetical protein [Thermococcus piezophilus]ANF23159.1 hypothetical protein A7C91_08260 [Thermococcus piezophilus]
MAKCPLCGTTLNWAELIEQMLPIDDAQAIFKDKERFMGAFESFVFKCPTCGDEFYGGNLPRKEAEKVFDLLNEFNGSIDWEKRRVRLRLNSLLALDMMLEQWDKKVKG